MRKRSTLLAMTAVLIFAVGGCAHKGTKTDTSGTTPKIYNNDIYEFVDPDTGVHYWIYSHKIGYSGAGGMTPRLNADGSVMTDN